MTMHCMAMVYGVSRLLATIALGLLSCYQGGCLPWMDFDGGWAEHKLHRQHWLRRTSLHRHRGLHGMWMMNSFRLGMICIFLLFILRV
ncbi:hypothetical protein V8C37DRAFT_366100, partial [Trichoderma ceciliae]